MTNRNVQKSTKIKWNLMYQNIFIPFLKNVMWSHFQNIFSLHLKYSIFKKRVLNILFNINFFLQISLQRMMFTTWNNLLDLGIKASCRWTKHWLQNPKILFMSNPNIKEQKLPEHFIFDRVTLSTLCTAKSNNYLTFWISFLSLSKVNPVKH